MARPTSRQPPAQPEHVDVERVAPGGAFGPAGPGERLAADDGTEAVEQGAGEARLDRGSDTQRPCQRSTPSSSRLGSSWPGPPDEAERRRSVSRRARMSIVGGRDADPVLEGIVDDGRPGRRGDEEEAGPPERGETIALAALCRPTHQHDVGVHGGDPREAIFLNVSAR